MINNNDANTLHTIPIYLPAVGQSILLIIIIYIIAAGLLV